MKFNPVHADEKVRVYLQWVILYLLNLGLVLGWTVIHTILVKRMGIEYLPYSYIGMSFFAISGGSIYLLFADKLKRQTIFIISLLLTLTLLLISRLFITNHFEGETGLTNDLLIFGVLILIAQGSCGATLTMQAWTMISDVFSPNQGKRLYPILGTATLLGGMTAGVFIPILIPLLGVGNLLIAWAIILLTIIPFVIALAKTKTDAEITKEVRETKVLTSWQNVKEGFLYTKKSAAAKLLVGISLGFSVVNSFQDFQFTQIMAHHFQSEKSLATFYGYYWVAFNVSTIVLQLFATEKIIRSLGVIYSFAVLPLLITFNFILLMLNYGFLEGLWMRYSWDMFATAIQATAYQLSYGGVVMAYRGRVRGWVEGIVNPTAAISTGFLLIFIQFFIGHSSEALWNHAHIFTGFGIACSVAWFFWIMMQRSAYRSSLLKNIREGDPQTKADALELLEKKRPKR
jgi:AAA family ATP:ADP antiporter